MPNSFRQILTKDYNQLVKQYGEYLPWLFDKEAMLEAAICYYPEYFTDPTLEQIGRLSDMKYTEYLDLQTSLRNKINGLDFGQPLYDGECVLQAYGRSLQVLSAMQKFESLFKNLNEQDQQEDSGYSFIKDYGAYGAVLSLVDGYGLSIKEVEGFTANQVFVNLDYLRGKDKAEKLNKQLRGSMATP